MTIEEAMWKCVEDVVEPQPRDLSVVDGYSARWRADGSAVRVQYMYMTDQQLEDLQTLRGLRLLHIVEIWHIATFDFHGRQYTAIVEEYLSKNLAQELYFRGSERQFFTPQEVWQHITALIWTFARLQDLHVAHRYIEPYNISLTAAGKQMKIGNFWRSRRAVPHGSADYTLVENHCDYRSPLIRKACGQRLKTVHHNPYKSDVYSLGMVLTNLLNYTDSIADDEYTDYLQQLRDMMLAEVEDNRPDFINLCSMIWPKISSPEGPVPEPSLENREVLPRLSLVGASAVSEYTEEIDIHVRPLIDKPNSEEKDSEHDSCYCCGKSTKCAIV